MLFRENYSIIGLRQRRAHLIRKVTKKSETSAICDKDSHKHEQNLQDFCTIGLCFSVFVKFL